MMDGADSYRRFLGGEKEAITEIVEAYRAGLEYFLLSVTGDEDIAEEIDKKILTGKNILCNFFRI